jgi:hypothetical protein
MPRGLSEASIYTTGDHVSVGDDQGLDELAIALPWEVDDDLAETGPIPMT